MYRPLKKNRLIAFIIASFGVHTLFILGFILYAHDMLGLQEGRAQSSQFVSEIVWVEEQSSLAQGSTLEQKVSKPVLRQSELSIQRKRTQPVSKTRVTSQPASHSTQIRSVESSPGLGKQGRGADESSRGGQSTILTRIYRRIQRAKVYPLQAQKNGWEGVVQVSFQLIESGRLKEVKIVKSSGYPVLDEAALKTLHRAQPFPFYSDEISIPIRYQMTKQESSF